MRDAIAEAVRKPTPEEEEASRAFDEQEALYKWYLGQRQEMKKTELSRPSLTGKPRVNRQV